MYTPRASLSGLFVKICLFVLSLYTIGRLVTLPCEGKVWSVYIHAVNRIISFRDMAIWSFFQDGRRPPSWIWSNRKWRRSIRRPRKPHPRTKHEGLQMTRCRVMAIWNFPTMCELALRSVGRRSSIFILLTLISYTPLSLRLSREE